MSAQHRSDAVRGPESGVALLLALLFVVLLTAIVVEYSYENRVEASFVENSKGDFEAEVAAKSAVASGLALLAADLSMDENFENASTTLNNSARRVNPGAQPANNTPLAAGARVDSMQDAWAMGIPYRPLNAAAMQCAIEDEYGKLNINALVPPELAAVDVPDPIQTGNPPPAGGPKQRRPPTASQSPPTGGNPPGTNPNPLEQPDTVLEEAFRALFRERGMEEDPVDAIMDWIDPDDESRTNGAESGYYGGLQTPYSCKNAPMDSVEELLLIRGITPAVFFGDAEQGQLPLTELLTVHGQRRGRININTAPPEVLMAFGEALGQQNNLAEIILEQRENSPFTSDEDATGRGVTVQPQNTPAPNPRGGTQTPAQTPPNSNPGGTPNPNPNAPRAKSLREKPFVYASNVFRIRGCGESEEAAVLIEAFVWRGNATSSGNNQVNTGLLNTSRNPRANNSAIGSAGRSGPRNNSRNMGGTDFSGPEGGGALPIRILNWRMMR